MARIDSTLTMVEHLRAVFQHRDETEVSAKVMGRDVPLRVGKMSLASYAKESYGSLEMYGIDAKVNGGETPVDSVSRQRSRRVGGNAPDGGDGAGAAVGDVRSVPISSVEPKVGFAPSGGTLTRAKAVATAADGAPPKMSGLRAALESRSKRGHNPLDKWLEFSGEGHPPPTSLSLQVYITFAATMKERYDAVNVTVLKRATVRDTLGLILATYTNQGRQPQITPKVEAFELRMVEDGCEPDLDLPALDLNQPIARFEFDSYCLVQSTAFEGAAFGSGADQQGSAEPESRVVRVQCAREWSKLKIEATMTVKELIETVVAKRKMRADIDYVLERGGQEGQGLDPDSLVIPDDGSVASTGDLDFELIRKHSMREAFRSRDDHPDNQWAVENSLTIHQTKTYLLSKQGGLFGSSRMVEFTVDPEGITINPFGKSGILGTGLGTGLLGLGTKHRPPVQVDIEQIVSCTGDPTNELTLRFTYFDQSDKNQKTYELEASSALEAEEIIAKISTIFRSKVGDRRTSAIK
eukprot:m.452111 g.452111  ORF g.452111 m.452111 type:complete len:523 (+) comp20269_c0_seq1:68-1636(+)